MITNISLLDEIRKGGYEASLITTFNAYLPFYEEVVLRRLMNSGVRHNVLLMDANQYSLSLDQHPPRLAGRQYSLLPIKMPGAFHPKLFFLVGKSKGLIIVGSHNMTLAGFGFNRELTNVVRISGANDREGVQLAKQAWRAINSWLETSSKTVPDQIKEMVAKVSDFAPWLSEVSEEGAIEEKLLVGSPGQESLLEQLTRYLGDKRVVDIAMTGAFFDSQLNFVKRVKEDLNPNRFIVALDPATVQIPAHLKNIPGITYVKADKLGTESEKNDNKANYLHAKCLYIHTDKDEGIFLSGSANPSSPAWVTDKDFGNAELMLARFGKQARDVAKKLGFLSLASMPELDEAEWTEIASSWDSKNKDDVGENIRTGVAVVEGDRVIVLNSLILGLDQATYSLLEQDRHEIARATEIITKTNFSELVFSKEQLANACWLYCQSKAGKLIELWLHHSGLVAEQARTGIQRQFKAALHSLETDTPDIGLLINCIDKIVFAEESTTHQVLIKASSEKETSSREAPDQDTLAIDVTETRKHQPKKRLEHSSDFGYLLDALLYHLRMHDDKSYDEIDQLGRSEEEQVGQDDDPDVENEKLSEDKRVELLEICHKKVRLLVNRMISQLKAYLKGKQDIDVVLVRLLGVLVVFRELRRCDGRVAWVEKGKTTVPQEERLRLFEEVMLTLFEGDTSLLHLESLGESFQLSEDIARLKGLLVWLAWDCGLTLKLQKPFMESPIQEQERLKHNAMMLALAQAIQNDNVGLDEARQSIGSLTSSEMDWLVDLQILMKQCCGIIMRDSHLSFLEGAEAQAGDIAVHKNAENWDLRVVSSSGGRQVSLIKLNKKEDSKSYSAEYLLAAKLDDKFWRNSALIDQKLS